MRAQLDGRPDTLLVPMGRTVFDTADGAYRLRFEETGNGSVMAVKLDERRVTLVQTPPSPPARPGWRPPPAPRRSG
jgi:hypothetical protein